MIYIIGVFKMNIKEMSIDDFKKEVELFLNNISEEEILDGIQKYVDKFNINRKRIIVFHHIWKYFYIKLYCH